MRQYHYHYFSSPSLYTPTSSKGKQRHLANIKSSGFCWTILLLLSVARGSHAFSTTTQCYAGRSSHRSPVACVSTRIRSSIFLNRQHERSVFSSTKSLPHHHCASCQRRAVPTSSRFISHRHQSFLSSSTTALSSTSSSESSDMEMNDDEEDEDALSVRQILHTLLRVVLHRIVSVAKQPLSQTKQWMILLVYYFFHLLVLSQHCILFGWQLIPNDKGHFCGIGWDAVAGMISLAAFLYVKRGMPLFRLPWRRLVERFPIPFQQRFQRQSTVEFDVVEPSDEVNDDNNDNIEDYSSVNVEADESMVPPQTIEKEIEVVEQVLEQAPKQIGLQRSPKKKPAKLSDSFQDETLNSLDLLSQQSESNQLKAGLNTTTAVIDASGNENDVSYEAIIKAKEITISNDAPGFAIGNDLSTTDDNLDTTSSSTDDYEARPLESNVRPTIQIQPGATRPRSDEEENDDMGDWKIIAETDGSGEKKELAKNSLAASESQAPTFSLANVFNNVQQQLKSVVNATKFTATIKPATATDGNSTRIETQGPDLSPLAIPPAGPERRLMLARGSSLMAIFVLVKTYFETGKFSFFWEDALYAMAGLGFPLTVAMHRSLCVLLGHLTWVAFGSIILGVIPRPRFFGRNTLWYRQNNVDDRQTEDAGKQKSAHLRLRRRQKNWVWWVIGGYSVSAWLFNIADFVNLYTLPAQVLEDAILQEGVVTQLINPENNDFLASVVGYIAPCISAPWWEEVLYRGFFFPALTLYLPIWASVLISGIVFSAHHLSLTAALPLAVLGWTWAALYMASDNLWTTIVVHALWNSRVFLSSWLGV